MKTGKLTKEKRSVSLAPNLIDLIEFHPGANFSIKLENALKAYAKLGGFANKEAHSELPLGPKSEKPPRSFDPTEGISNSAKPEDLDNLFENEKRIFGELSKQNNLRYTFDALVRPEDDTAATGYGLSPYELLVEKVALLEKGLDSARSVLKILADVDKVNADPEIFKTRLIVALQTQDNDLSLALLDQIGA